MKKKFKMSGIAKPLTVLIAGILIFYVAYQIYKIFYNPIKTEFALLVDDVYDSATINNVFIVRDESVIKNPGNKGVIAYLFEDGDRVAKGEKVAAFYKSEDDIAKKYQVLKLENQIRSLQQLNILNVANDTNPNVIDKQVTHELKSILACLNEMDYKNLKNREQKFLHLISERQFMTHQATDFSGKIKELEKKKRSIDLSTLQEQGCILSENAGYFSRRVDGYETAIDYKSIRDVTLDDFKTIQGQERKPDENLIGKIVSNQNWYIVAPLKSEDSLKIKVNDELKFLIPSVFTNSIPITVESINQKNKSSDALVIFKCDHMNQDLILARRESIKIIFDAYSGIRVNKHALHENVLSKTVKTQDGQAEEIKKTVKGVYVLYAGELIFKEVVPIYTDANYVICDPNPNNESLFIGETVKAYDQVVTEGNNLYDGKII